MIKMEIILGKGENFKMTDRKKEIEERLEAIYCELVDLGHEQIRLENERDGIKNNEE